MIRWNPNAARPGRRTATVAAAAIAGLFLMAASGPATAQWWEDDEAFEVGQNEVVEDSDGIYAGYYDRYDADGLFDFDDEVSVGEELEGGVDDRFGRTGALAGGYYNEDDLDEEGWFDW